MQDKLFEKEKAGKITILYNTRLMKFWATIPALPACASRTLQTGATQNVDVFGVFIAIGHKPNTDIFAGQLAMEGGY
jgi:thioredoxin reductase (NADPH)